MLNIYILTVPGSESAFNRCSLCDLGGPITLPGLNFSSVQQEWQYIPHSAHTGTKGRKFI